MLLLLFLILLCLVLYYHILTYGESMKIFDIECETAADAYMLILEKGEEVSKKYGVRSIEHHELLKSEDYNKALNWFLQEQEKAEEKEN